MEKRFSLLTQKCLLLPRFLWYSVQNEYIAVDFQNIIILPRSQNLSSKGGGRSHLSVLFVKQVKFFIYIIILLQCLSFMFPLLVTCHRPSPPPCLSSLLSSSSPSPSPSSSSSSSPSWQIIQQWGCKICTYAQNSSEDLRCQMCDGNRGAE